MAIKRNYAKKPPVLRATAGMSSAHSSLSQSEQLTDSQNLTSNLLTFLVPPLCLVGIFFFCKTNTFTPSEQEPTSTLSSTTKGKATTAIAAKPAKVEPPKISQPADINNDLPTYAVPAHKTNLLIANTASVSMGTTKDKYVAENAIDGSIENTATLAVAPASADQAWWKAEFKGNASPSAVSSIVIYGGGSASPVGKMQGGVEISIESTDGQTTTHKICEEGYAIEGYEVWDLDSPTTIKSVSITPLKPDCDLVLREVQIIGDKF